MKRILCGLLMICMMVSVAFADSYTDMLETAEKYSAAGDIAHALASYHLAQEIDSTKVDAFYGEAFLMFSQGDYESAKALAQKVLQLDPVFPDAWALICRIDVVRKDVTSFESDLIYAEVCNADISFFAADIAVMYAENGMYEKAGRYFDSVNVDVLEEEQKALYKRTLIATGNRDKAEELGLITAGTRNTKLDNAFNNDKLLLKKVEMPEIDINDFEFSDDFGEVTGVEKPEDINAYLEAYISKSEPQLLSIGPTGNSRVYNMDGTGVGYYNGKYHVLYSSQKRGVSDKYGNLERYYQKAFQNNRILSIENVIYSPDGRYAAIYKAYESLEKGQYFLDPIIIDLSTGEMILTATYNNKPKDGIYGAVATACFSSDNRYFYYILYGNTTEDRFALYRYDINSGMTELCCSIPYFAYYPYLSETEAGSLILVEGQIKKDTKQSILLISQSNGRWTFERKDFSIDGGHWFVDRLLHSYYSDIAFAAGYSLSYDNALGYIRFMIIKPNEEFAGLNVYHAIDKAEKRIVGITEEEYQSAFEDAWNSEVRKIDLQIYPFASISKATLSPDGYYAMLLTREGTEEAHLYLLKLDTFELREVRGIDATKIPDENIATKYMPIIEWNSDTLIILYDGEILTYQFDYE